MLSQHCNAEHCNDEEFEGAILLAIKKAKRRREKYPDNPEIEEEHKSKKEKGEETIEKTIKDEKELDNIEKEKADFCAELGLSKSNQRKFEQLIIKQFLLKKDLRKHKKKWKKCLNFWQEMKDEIKGVVRNGSEPSLEYAQFAQLHVWYDSPEEENEQK